MCEVHVCTYIIYMQCTPIYAVYAYICNINLYIQIYAYTHREKFPKSYEIKLISDCIYHFLIEFESHGRPFGSKSIGKYVSRIRNWVYR